MSGWGCELAQGPCDWVVSKTSAPGLHACYRIDSLSPCLLLLSNFSPLKDCLKSEWGLGRVI